MDGLITIDDVLEDMASDNGIVASAATAYYYENYAKAPDDLPNTKQT